MGTKKGKKLLAIKYMEFRVLSEKYSEIGDVPGAFSPDMAHQIFPMTHIKWGIQTDAPKDDETDPYEEKDVEKDDEERPDEKPKKKEKDIKAEPYLKDEKN